MGSDGLQGRHWRTPMEPVRQPLGSHLSGSVPISIAVHVVVVLLVLIIPLTAIDPASLVIPTRVQEYMRAVPLPPPPQVALTRAPRTTPARPVDVNVAPTDAPPAIAPEVPTSSALALPPPTSAPSTPSGSRSSCARPKRRGRRAPCASPTCRSPHERSSTCGRSIPRSRA